MVNKVVPSKKHIYKYCSQRCNGLSKAGIKRPPELGAKISKSKKGKASYRPGYHHSPEVKAKIALSNKVVSAKKREQRLRENPNYHDCRLIHTTAEYRDWRKKILKRFGYKCAECGNTKRLQSHHIVSIAQLPSAAFETWNGVCLCEQCHHKTDSWGRVRQSIPDEKTMLIILSIPNSWQEYPTVGNWKWTKDNVLVILVSKLEDERYEFLIAIHEYIEAVTCRHRGISQSSVDSFDILYEAERDMGLHKDDEEPGFDKRAPYRKEHEFATKIEMLCAHELGVNWKRYDKEIVSL